MGDHPRQDLSCPSGDYDLLASIIENSPDAIILGTADGVFLAVNLAAEEMLNLDRGQVLGRSFEELRFLDDKDVSRARLILEMSSRGDPVPPQSFTVHREGKSALEVQIRTRPVELAGGRGIIVIGRDITDQRDSERRTLLLSTAISQAAEAVVITTVDGVIEYVNPAFERISGFTQKEVIGRRPSILKSGEQEPRFYRELWNTILSGKVWEGRMRNRRKDGRIYEEESSISPVRGDAGEISHFVAVKRDVSKVVELEKQLRQSQKMEALGILAGGIAHDFNNILTPILGYSQLIRVDLPPDSHARERLGRIVDASMRAKDLVRQILTFSRGTEGDRAPTDPRVLVKESLKFLEHSIPANVRIRKRIASDCGLIQAEPTQIYQVLLNLLTNAYQSFGSGGGEILVSLDTVSVDKDNPRIPRGRYIELIIEDTGCGMGPDTLSRAFEPFFTTKGTGQGTGLGLSVVHGIITGHKGSIEVTSTDGKGTRVRVLLPHLDEGAAAPSLSSEIVLGTGTVVVVDDQEETLLAAADMLEHLGYATIRFTDPLGALELFRSRPPAVDLLLTDCVMPALSGLDLVREIRELVPGLPVVLMTGQETDVAGEAEKELPILRKPFDLVTLARLTYELIEGTQKAA